MVFVLDVHHKPLMPCPEKRARQLLERRRAVIDQMALFTIRLKDRAAENSLFQPLGVKFDHGRKTTGVAIVLTGDQGPRALFLGEIVHKVGIKAKLDPSPLRDSDGGSGTRGSAPREVRGHVHGSRSRAGQWLF